MDDVALTGLPTRELVARLATRDPIPGGGSASALAGAMGAALVEMVVALTSGRPAAAQHEATLAEIGERAGHIRHELLDLTERDAEAYDAVIRARRMPHESQSDAASRGAAMASATREATRIPLETVRAAAAVFDLAERLVPIGNRNAISDVGVAALLAAASMRGAALNVRINLPYLDSSDSLSATAATEVDVLLAGLHTSERSIADRVAERMA
jgi:formiminotetrahydrofolate cyclodeaminase